MSLPALGVHRPVLTAMVALMVVVLGLVALGRLRVDLLPEVETPTLTVQTEWPGANPLVVERMLTQIVEETVATVPGVVELRSTSAEGQSSVTVTFAQGTDLDAAANDVRDRLDREADELPEEATRPQLRKFDVASFPVVILGVSSELDPVELTELVDEQVQHRFERIPGVASVDVFGGYDREVRIELDPDRLRALALPLDGVLGALRDANVVVPAGELVEGRYEVSLQTPSEFTDLDQIRDTVVAVRSGAPVTLGQIARVEDTYRDLTQIVRVNGRRGLRLGIRKQADANTVEVASAVFAEMEAVNVDLPQIAVVPVIDQGSFIERSIANVGQSVLYGGALAVLVLLAFLGDLRSTAVIAVAIPISVLATFAMLAGFGLSLNLMTLGGLALGVGLMVDSSIVVVENVFRRRVEEGEGPAQAALNGTSEVTGALIASTLTTLVIFLPLGFARGVAGLLFRELALVIAFSLTASLLVALALVPMLAARWMTGPRRAGGGRIDRLLARVEAGYARVLDVALTWGRTTLFTAAAGVAAGLLLGRCVGTEFLPPSDEGEVRVTGEMEVGTKLELVDRQTRRMEAIVAAATPEAVSTVATVGPSGRRPDATSEGELRISVGPASGRSRSNEEIADDLRRRLAGEIPGMVVRTRAPQGQFLLERVLGSEEGLTVEIRGFDLEVLAGLATVVERELAEVDGISDVRSNRAAGVPTRWLETDRRKAESLGVSPRRVAEVVQTAVAGVQVGDFRSEGVAHRIFVRLADIRSRTLEEVLDLTVASSSGREIALRNLMSVREGLGPVLVDRKDQQRMVSVAANVAGRDLGSVAADVRARLAGVARPSGYELTLGGSVEAQGEASRELGLTLGLSLVLVFMVLAGQYESLRDPLVVMLSVPAAGVGVVLALWATGSTLNVQSGIGCVLLGGIVVNNAILIVDQAGRLLAEGRAPLEAAREAGRRRLRPVLMTTLTTVLGLLPLGLGLGEGADAQAPLARAVLGGLSVSTLVVLVVVPAAWVRVARPRADVAAGGGG